MAHKVYQAIVTAVSSASLTEPFSSADFRAACPGFGEGTYRTFLVKHRAGNSSGESELFERVAPGRYCCLRPFRYAPMAEQVAEVAEHLWIGPEIERRQSEGTLPQGKAKLYCAEILSRIDPSAKSGSVEVRLNQEGRALIKIRGKERPEHVFAYHGSGDDVEDVFLPEPEDDCIHIVIFAVDGGGRMVKADRRFRLSTIRRMIEVAAQFLASAGRSIDVGELNSAAECLFAAVELTAKAHLYLEFETRYFNSASHKGVGSAYNLASRRGAVKPDHAKLYNRLGRLRKAARYAEEPLSLTVDAAAKMLEIAQEMHDEIAGELPPDHRLA